MELPRAAAASTYFQDLDWIIDTLQRIETFSKQVPNCIIHGDANPGNVFYERDGTPAFFDTVPRRMPALSEAAYHIALLLDPMDRPHWEAALVRHYLGELQKHGINPPSFEDAMLKYGVFLADALILSLFNAPGIIPEGRAVAFVVRESAAMIDNNTVELLKSIT